MNIDLALAADQLLADLCQKHPMGNRPAIQWRGYRVSAGMAYFKTGIIGLSHLVIKDQQQLEDTLKHEYAHLLAYHRHGRKAIGHGEHWKQAMLELGLKPKVCHNYTVQRNERRQEVGYLCQRCGKTLVRARKLPKKRRYVHVGCGGWIKYAWTRQVTLRASEA